MPMVKLNDVTFVKHHITKKNTDCNSGMLYDRLHNTFFLFSLLLCENKHADKKKDKQTHKQKRQINKLSTNKNKRQISQ